MLTLHPKMSTHSQTHSERRAAQIRHMKKFIRLDNNGIFRVKIYVEPLVEIYRLSPGEYADIFVEDDVLDQCSVSLRLLSITIWAGDETQVFINGELVEPRFG